MARLNASCPGEPWTRQHEALTHVVRVAAAKVRAQKGALVPYKGGTYDTMANIAPGYWLKPTRFDELLEAPEQEAPPPRCERREHLPYEDDIDLLGLG